jgi:hypothetical protein
LIGDTDAAARSKARAAMQRLLRSAKGRTLARPWRRAGAGTLCRVVLTAAAAVGVGAVAAAGVFLAVLAAGPIDVESLKPGIAQSLEERLGDRYAVAIGSTYLTRIGGGVGLSFGGIAIRDRAGRMVLSAPGGRVGLDALSLLTLTIKVRRLELDGLDLRLSLRRDGALSIAAAADPAAAAIDLPAPPAPEDAGAPDFGLAVFRIIDTMTGASRALDHVSLARGHLEVANEALGKKTVYDDFALSFDRNGDAASIRASARGAAGSWSIEATARGGEARTLSLDARDLSLDDMLVMHVGHPPFEADMPMSFKVEARLAANSSIQTLQGRFVLGAGYFRLDDPDHEPFFIDEATGAVAWDPSRNRYRFSDLQILSGATHIFGRGWLAPPTTATPAWVARIESQDAVFGPERPGEKPIVIDQATLDARYLSSEARLIVDRLAVHGPTVNGEGGGEFAQAADGATLKMKLQMGPSALLDVVRLWPSFINADARNWCLQNVRGGQVVSGAMTVDWDPAALDAAVSRRAVPASSVRGDFSLRDAAVEVLPGIPPLAGLDAVGVITGKEFSVAAKSGVMELSPSRRIQAADVVYAVPDTAPAPVVPARASARLQGGADALADLLNRDALKRYVDFAVDPAMIKGQFEGKLAIDLKLGKTVRPEDNQFHAEGSLSNFRIDHFLADERLEQASLSILADRGDIKIAGQGQMYGVPVAVDMSKGANDEGSVTLSLSLDDAARAKLNFPFADMLSGPMGVRVKAPLSKSSAEVEADLARVAIASPQTGTLKAAGKPGKATFSFKGERGAVAVNSIVVDAGAVSIRGVAQMAPDGAVQSAKLTQLRLSAADELKADIVNGDGGMKATVRGATLDARALIKGFLSAGGPSEEGKDLDLDVKIANVLGSNSQSLGQFEMTGVWRGGVARSLRAKARIGEGTLTAQQDENGPLRARVTDAGALGKLLDVYNRMEGGTLDLTVERAGDDSRGSANVNDFVLRDEPALRQLAAAGRAPGDEKLGQTPLIEAGAVRFEKLSARFTRSAGRLDLREAVIFNSQMGLTTEGYIDYGRDRVDLNGTYVPAYQVNNLVTHIPVVGALLGGGRHEGLLGVNYRIVGPASGPTLTVNPLSAMTPGFLRKVFGAVDGTTPFVPPEEISSAPATGAPMPLGAGPGAH